MTSRTSAERAWRDFAGSHPVPPVATLAHHERSVFMAGFRAGRARTRAVVTTAVLLAAARSALRGRR